MIIPRGTDYLTIAGSPAASFDFGDGIGVVALQMKPVGPGNTNTIRRRLEHAHLPTPGSSDTIPVEIVLISTESVEPVQIQGRMYRVFIRLTPGKPSIGRMTITRSTERDEEKYGFGGTFTTCILCHFTTDFTPIDGSLGSFSVASSVVLETQTPGNWSSIPEPGTVRLHGALDSQTANIHRDAPQGTGDFFIVGRVFDGLEERGGHVLAASMIGPEAGGTDFDADTLQPLQLKA